MGKRSEPCLWEDVRNHEIGSGAKAVTLSASSRTVLSSALALRLKASLSESASVVKPVEKPGREGPWLSFDALVDKVLDVVDRPLLVSRSFPRPFFHDSVLPGL